MIRAVLIGLVFAAGDAGAPAQTHVPADSAVFRLDQRIVGGEAAVFRELARWAHKGGAKRILVIIDSRGGQAQAALSLYEAIRSSPLPTRCEVRGNAFSGAFLVLQSCSFRVATAESQLSTHRPSAVIPGPMLLTVEAAAETARELAEVANAMDGLIAKRLRMSLASYRVKVAGVDWDMAAAAALAANAIDAVIP